MDVKAFLINIPNSIGVTYNAFCEFPENKDKASLFYLYMDKIFRLFISHLSQIEQEDLIHHIKEFGDFRGKITKKRFINLIKYICQELLCSLRYSYCYDKGIGNVKLEKLLRNNNPKLLKYLTDNYFNYCSSTLTRDLILYRMRDGKIDEKIDNCWHTPYFIRQNSYTGRFSQAGYPCLYLSSDPETSNLELKSLNEGYIRWLGTFILKPGKSLICLDLTRSTKNEIKEMESYDLICNLLSWPLKSLCSIEGMHKSDGFCEEYLFSQLLMEVITSSQNKDNGIVFVHGIKYNSVKTGRFNYVLPAISKNIPSNPDEKFSIHLQELFEHPLPTVYEVRKKLNNN